MISWGLPDEVAVVEPDACARTWLKLELFMVNIISCCPFADDTIPCEVITWVMSCAPKQMWYEEKKKKNPLISCAGIFDVTF